MTKAIARTLVFICVVFSSSAFAEIVETQMRVPVAFTWRNEPVAQDVIVTRFQDSDRKPSRFVVILHGRAVKPEDRAAAGRTRFSDIARDLASQGYAVFVPTRIGYGDTGGPDIEITGPCNDKNYVRGMARATDIMVQVIDTLRKDPDIGNSAGYVIGQSVGGFMSMALAARNVPRIVAYVNFSGGSGGNPKEKPAQPCEPDKLAQAFATYGATARAPTLWLYSENDKFWGAELPREWFAAFRKAGGRGRFVSLPPYGEDGHMSFIRNRPAWRETVLQFLQNPQ